MIVSQPNGVKYTKIGYRLAWEDFMKKRFQLVIDKHSLWLNEYSKKLADYSNANANSINPAQARRILEIVNQVTNKPAFPNPYP